MGFGHRSDVVDCFYSLWVLHLLDRHCELYPDLKPLFVSRLPAFLDITGVFLERNGMVLMYHKLQIILVC